MLWARFKAQGIPWQESHSAFQTEFSDFKISIVGYEQEGWTHLAPVTSF